MPSVPWRVESAENFKKNQKSFKVPKMPKIVAKSIQTCFEHVLGQTFRKTFAQFSVEGRVFENFQKNQKICKIPKMPKIVPKSIQTCFELVLSQIFRNFFLPSVPWRAESSKIFLKIKKFSKMQKCPKSFPKVSKHVLNMFWGKLFENFLPSFPWNVESSKIFKKNIFKIPKMPKSVPKRLQTCFRVIFSKKSYAQCSTEDRDFEKFQKKSEKFQNSKNAQNCCQKYPNVF